MSDLLILIPTEYEAQTLVPALPSSCLPPNTITEICGFGPVAAGIRTAQLLARHGPRQCILAGIAGRYSPHLEIGAAYSFSSSSLTGIGAGSGSEFRSATEMGWKQWQVSAEIPNEDMFALSQPKGIAEAGLLLTVCAAAATADEVRQRLNYYPEAVAEDMEGYAVAMACYAANVTVSIVRGISNQAGNRDQSHWKTKEALVSVAQALSSCLRPPIPEPTSPE